jgi:hypothetical protein
MRRTEDDRILSARIAGVASRHARRRDADMARAEAIAELAELAAGRSDYWLGTRVQPSASTKAI